MFINPQRSLLTSLLLPTWKTKGDWSSFQEGKPSGKIFGSSSSSWEFQMEFGMDFWDAVSFWQGLGAVLGCGFLMVMFGWNFGMQFPSSWQCLVNGNSDGILGCRSSWQYLVKGIWDGILGSDFLLVIFG